MSYSDAYDPDDGVAIIGLAGRFPGARNVEELWQNLVEGRETISVFSDNELEAADPDEMAARRQPGYVRSRGILADVDYFDAAFFGINPNEAAIIDPQQRVFMETAWEALESAGYDPRSFPGPIGVFAGMSNNSYFLQHLLSRHDVTDVVGWLTTMMGNEKDYLATRVSYKLDLRGPALNLQTACSTSLVAVASAVQSLLTYQCDLALAGGVSITLPQRRGYLHEEGGITSPDGHCRSFDERAAGTVFSNGVGIVTLRRLVDAITDGNTIFAVIKGVGLNNDGASKVSFTAPSVDGHAGVITMAQALAGIDPQTISYVEAHGTATALGDPIEIAGLTQAFRAGGAAGEGYCGIGSIKSAIGHLDAAAGVAGLIKTALALHHKTLPPSLHFTAPNPKLDLERSPFRVVDSLRPWRSPEGQPRGQLVRRWRNQRARRPGGGSASGAHGGERYGAAAGPLGAIVVGAGCRYGATAAAPGGPSGAFTRRRCLHTAQRPATIRAPPGCRGTRGRGSDRKPRRAWARADGHRLGCPRGRLGGVPVPRAGSAVRRDGAPHLRSGPRLSRRHRRLCGVP
jgi:acyl transferase domain-containing protein